LFAQATFNASAGYRPVYTIFLFTLHDSSWNKLPFYIIYKVLPWDGQLQQCCPYKTGLLLILKSFAVLHALAAMFNDCIIKTISSDVESREEQDGSKYSFVGRTTVELQAILQVYM